VRCVISSPHYHRFCSRVAQSLLRMQFMAKKVQSTLSTTYNVVLSSLYAGQPEEDEAGRI
jgi:hypothetical protein